MSKEAIVFVRHVIDSIENIESFTKGVTKADFMKNKEKQSAVVHQIEIIGEAAKNIPKEFKQKYPFIAWNDIIRTRDKITHHYFGVDLNIVWDIVKKDLPKLKKNISQILRKEIGS